MRTRAIAAPSVGLGASATTVLRTSFFANATAAVGTGIWTGFLKPGSAFDPCGDLAAIQPATYDQFAAVYGRYKVNSCTVSVRIMGTSGGYAFHAATYPSVDSTAMATYQGAASQPWAKTAVGGFQISGGTGIGANFVTLKHQLKHDAVVGSRSDAYDSGALVTADPTALQFMVLPIFVQSADAGARQFVLHVDMWQNVTFSQRKPVVDA